MRTWRTSALLALVLATALSVVRAMPSVRPARPPDLVVDLNTSPPELLSTLPRIGPSLAGRIVAARHSARIVSAQDLRSRVRGVGPATTALLAPYLPAPDTSLDRMIALRPQPNLPRRRSEIAPNQPQP